MRYDCVNSILFNINFDAGLIAVIFYKIQFKEKGVKTEYNEEIDHIDNIDSIFTGKFPGINVHYIIHVMYCILHVLYHVISFTTY